MSNAEPTCFSVASYNVHRCVGTDGRHKPERISRVIRELNSDVIGLQEVDSFSNKGEFSLQMDHLADATGLSAIPGPTIQTHERFYGNVLLTRHPPLRIRRYDLSISRREPRGAIDAVLKIQGKSVRVIVTHFGLRAAERRQQAEHLLTHLELGPNEVCTLLGDTNDWSALGPAARRLDASFGRTPIRRTYPSFFPVFPLDRIWVAPSGALKKLTVHRSHLSRIASDHLPIRATVCT